MLMSHETEIKVINNVLLGKIKVISTNGRVVYSTKNVESTKSSRQRIKNSFLLFRLIQGIKARQHILVNAKKKIIQIQSDSIIRS